MQSCLFIKWQEVKYKYMCKIWIKTNDVAVTIIIKGVSNNIGLYISYGSKLEFWDITFIFRFLIYNLAILKGL